MVPPAKARTHKIAGSLLQLNAHAFGAVQQPSEMKAGKRVAGMRPTRAAKAGIAAVSTASSLAKASEYCAVALPVSAVPASGS